jgi:Kef-type K+ transport system membrane component KefB
VTSTDLETVAYLAALLPLMWVAGRLGAALLERLHQPGVIGEILAGIIIGPTVLGVIDLGAAYIEGIDLVAEVGIVLLLFIAGLATPPDQLRRVGRTAGVVAVSGVVAPLAAGAGLMFVLGASTPTALFVGAALVATSVGITARVLTDLGQETSVPGRVILGAAVIDDVLGLLVLAVVGALALGSSEGPYGLAGVIGLALGFVLLSFMIAPRGVRRWLARHMHPHPGNGKPPAPSRRLVHLVLAASLGVCAVFAVAAATVQLAPIVGAFIAGVAFAEFSGHFEIQKRLERPERALVPIFFVLMGANVSLRDFSGEVGLIALAAVMLAVACVTKYVPCWLAARPLGRWEAHMVGVGMMPRGEVGLIVATYALSAGLVDRDLFSVVVIVAIGTSLAAPPLLRRAVRGAPRGPAPS